MASEHEPCRAQPLRPLLVFISTEATHPMGRPCSSLPWVPPGLTLGGRALPGAAGQAALGMESGQHWLPTRGHYLLKTQESLQLKHIARGCGGGGGDPVGRNTGIKRN